MIENSNQPALSPFRLAIGGGVLAVVGIAILIAQYFVEGGAFNKFAFAFSIMFWGIPLVLSAVCLVTLRVITRPRVNPSPAPVAEQPKAAPVTREEAARAFWVEACKVAEATGNPGWRNGYKNFLSSDRDWQVWIKAPFVSAGFAIPKNTGNGETILWREGIDPRYVRGWLAGNLPPLPPEGWPPVWRKPQTADTGDSQKQGVYGDGQADSTVYASEREGIGR